jgi:hypothetical protein
MLRLETACRPDWLVVHGVPPTGRQSNMGLHDEVAKLSPVTQLACSPACKHGHIHPVPWLVSKRSHKCRCPVIPVTTKHHLAAHSEQQGSCRGLPECSDPRAHAQAGSCCSKLAQLADTRDLSLELAPTSCSSTFPSRLCVNANSVRHKTIKSTQHIC